MAKRLCLFVAALLVGCGSDAGGGDAAPGDAMLAVDASVSDAGGPDAAAPSCADNNGCAQTEFCAKASCTATTGICVTRPQNCLENGTPVCGCDDVNYWNDCVRRQHGMLGPRP